MKATITINNKTYTTNLSEGINISFSLQKEIDLPKAFYAPQFNIEAVRADTFVGSTEEGGILNFKNIFVNPHGNGTHTECVGHISKEPYFIKDCLKEAFHLAELVTINPEKIEKDSVITLQQVEKLQLDTNIKAIIIRTLPNSIADKQKDWSGTNPPYIHHKAMEYLVQQGIEHFLIDLPSVDREEDEGKLLAHKFFWNYPSNKVRESCTITEMIYADNKLKDGLYFVNLQIMPIKMDASPSTILVYEVIGLPIKTT